MDVRVEGTDSGTGLRKRSFLQRTVDRVEDVVFVTFSSAVSSEHGGSNLMGGVKITGRTVRKATAWGVALFLSFLTALSIFYAVNREGADGGGRIDLSGAVAVERRANWQEFEALSAPCKSASDDMLRTWTLTNESCVDGVCLRLEELFSWQLALTKDADSNFACSTFLDAARLPESFPLPCACTVVMSGGERVFFLQPEVVGESESRALATDSVPVLGLAKETRSIPTRLEVESAAWPAAGTGTLKKRSNVTGKDVNAMLRALKALGRRQNV